MVRPALLLTLLAVAAPLAAQTRKPDTGRVDIHRGSARIYPARPTDTLELYVAAARWALQDTTVGVLRTSDVRYQKRLAAALGPPPPVGWSQPAEVRLFGPFITGDTANVQVLNIRPLGSLIRADGKLEARNFSMRVILTFVRGRSGWRLVKESLGGIS